MNGTLASDFEFLVFCVTIMMSGMGTANRKGQPCLGFVCPCLTATPILNKALYFMRRCITCGGVLPRYAKKYCSEECWPKGTCLDCDKTVGRYATLCTRCASIKRWKDPEERKAQSERMKIINQGVEINRRRSLTMKKRCQNPLVRQKRSCDVRVAWARGDYEGRFTEEARARMSQSQKKRFLDPRERQKYSEIMSARWASGELDKRFDSGKLQAKISAGVRAAHERGNYIEVSEKIIGLWEQGVYDGVFKSPTSIEIVVAKALDRYGVQHTSQYRPDGYTRIYDEFIDPNLLIEIQGDFWHSLPVTQKRDIEKADWAENNGYHLMIMWEHEIREYGADMLVKERILPLLG